LVCGEEEVASGSVDVRNRDDKRMGKMRVDKLVEYFESLMPKPSPKSFDFYSKAWSADKYPE
jgi:threonyl-tRNA synthetase